MVAPPDWASSCTADSIVEHYAQVAAHGIPLMAVTNFLDSRPHPFGLRVLERLRDEVEGICAAKDDVCGEFGRRLSLLVHDRWALFASGTKREVLNAVTYGCDGYMSNFISFKPALAHAFWQSVQSRDHNGARSFIAENDVPFWDMVSDFRGGCDAVLHGILELKGLARRGRRAPYYSLSDEEMERLGHSLEEGGWV